MEPKRRGRPPKVNPTVVESVVVEPVKNQSRDAVIKVVLSMPGYADHEDTIYLKDIVGRTTGTQRNPEVFMSYLKSKIR